MAEAARDNVVQMRPKVIGRNEFLAEDTTEYKHVPGFKPDTVFCLRSVSAGAIIDWMEANDGEAKRTAGLRLIVAALVDGEPGVDEGATGNPIFTDKDIAHLRTKAHRVTEGLVKQIVDMNKMAIVAGEGNTAKNA